jgi:hypothetical protein
VWQHTPVSTRGWLLLACGGFGATYLVGELFGSPLLPSAELLAWVCLVAYVVVAGRDAPVRVRLALAAGVVILGALAAFTFFSTVDAGPGGLGFMALDEPPRESALDIAADAVREALPVLVAYACLALAALFLPKRRTRAGIAVAVVGIGVAVTYTVMELWSRDGLASVFAAMPPLLVAVLAFLVAGRVWRWTAAAGLALLGVAALSVLGDVLDRVYVSPLNHGEVFLQPGLRYSVQESVAVSLSAVGGRPALGFALVPVIQLAAAAAIAAGCLRRPATPPEVTEPGQS